VNPAARMVAGCVLAVVLPALALHFSADDARLAAGLSASPFGWPRVLVAHLVTALPLGFLVARRLRSLEGVNTAVRGLWVVIGLGVVGLGTLVAPAVGEGIGGGFGFVPLLFLRATLAFLLVLPWCVWAAEPAGPHGKPALAVVLAVAVLPCGVYADAVRLARTEQVQDLLKRERVVRADALLTGLVELGSDQPVGGKPPAEVRQQLAPVLAKLRRAEGRQLPPKPTPADRFNHALLMIQLERPGDAAAALEPLAPANDTAALLLASVYRDQEKWAASDELFAGVFEKRSPQAATDPAAREDCLVALNGLAFNAREDRRPADVERALTRGVELFPDLAAGFHYQLGRHFQDIGRPARAVEHLRTAARLDPQQFADPAGRAIRGLESATPACLLWRAK
jgi:hypothetical protein